MQHRSTLPAPPDAPVLALGQVPPALLAAVWPANDNRYPRPFTPNRPTVRKAFPCAVCGGDAFGVARCDADLCAGCRRWLGAR